MAAFNISCPHCEGALEVQDEWADMEMTCPYCKKTFIVPRRDVPAAEQKPAMEENAVSEEKTNKGSQESQPRDGGSEKNDDGVGFFGKIGGSLVILAIPILLSLCISWPRTIFWISFPLIALICLGCFVPPRKISDVLVGCLMLAGLVVWGFWIFTGALERLEIAVECEVVQNGSRKKTADCEIRLFPRNLTAENVFQQALFISRNMPHDPVKRHLELMARKFELEKSLLSVRPVEANNGILKDINNGDFTLMAVYRNGTHEFIWIRHIVKKTGKLGIRLSSDYDCLIIPKNVPGHG